MSLINSNKYSTISLMNIVESNTIQKTLLIYIEVDSLNQKEKLEKGPIRNLPSTVVRQEKPSVINSTIVIALATVVILAIWIYRYYGVNTFIIIDFYIREFFFNLNLIISDLAKIIHNTLN